MIARLSVRAPVASAIAKWFCRYISQDVCPWNVKFAQELKVPAFAARETLAGKDARAIARERETQPKPTYLSPLSPGDRYVTRVRQATTRRRTRRARPTASESCAARAAVCRLALQLSERHCMSPRRSRRLTFPHYG